jgi:hypothetical protein
MEVVGLACQYSQTDLRLSRKHPLNMATTPLTLDANVFRCEIDGSYAEVSNVGYGGAGMVLARGEEN